MAEQQPGQIISPGGQADPSAQPPQPAQEVSVPLQQSNNDIAAAPIAQQPQPVPPQPIEPPVPIQAQPPQPQPAQFTPETPPQQSQQNIVNEQLAPATQQFQSQEPDNFMPPQVADSQDAISWTASEYIGHKKSPAWFMFLGFGAVIVAAGVYFLTHDILSAIVIVMVAAVFGVYAGRQPREQQYAVSATGITIGVKTYGFDQLKTFSIIDEGPFSSIMFLPMKRLMPAISIYYDPQDEENIVSVLSNYLPMEPHKHDAVDSLMRRIRF